MVSQRSIAVLQARTSVVRPVSSASSRVTRFQNVRSCSRNWKRYSRKLSLVVIAAVFIGFIVLSGHIQQTLIARFFLINILFPGYYSGDTHRYDYNRNKTMETTQAAFDAIVYIQIEVKEESETKLKQTLCLSLLSLIKFGQWRDKIIILTNTDSDAYLNRCDNDVYSQLVLYMNQFEIVILPPNENSDSIRQSVKWAKNWKRKMFELEPIQKMNITKILILDSDIIVSKPIDTAFSGLIVGTTDIAMHSDYSAADCYFWDNSCNEFNAGVMVVRRSVATEQCFNQWTNAFEMQWNSEEQNALDTVLKSENNQCENAISTLDASSVVYAGCGHKLWFLRFYKPNAIFIHLARSVRYSYCAEFVLSAMKQAIISSDNSLFFV